MSVTIMNLVTPKAGAKHGLLFNEPASGLSENTKTDYLGCDALSKKLTYYATVLVTAVKKYSDTGPGLQRH